MASAGGGVGVWDGAGVTMGGRGAVRVVDEVVAPGKLRGVFVAEDARAVFGFDEFFRAEAAGGQGEGDEAETSDHNGDHRC
jgi:hypothetical protein